MRRLSVANGSELRPELGLAKDAEAEALIVGTVPRDVGERRQRESGTPTGVRPGDCAPDKGRPDSPALLLRHDAHLLDVGIAVDIVDQQVPDRRTGVVEGDPGPPVGGVLPQGLNGRGFMVGHRTEPDVAKPLAGGALNPPQGGCVPGAGWPDRDRRLRPDAHRGRARRKQRRVATSGG